MEKVKNLGTSKCKDLISNEYICTVNIQIDNCIIFLISRRSSTCEPQNKPKNQLNTVLLLLTMRNFDSTNSSVLVQLLIVPFIQTNPGEV